MLKRVERYQKDNQDLSFEEKLGTRQKKYGKRQASLQNTSAKLKTVQHKTHKKTFKNEVINLGILKGNRSCSTCYLPCPDKKNFEFGDKS